LNFTAKARRREEDIAWRLHFRPNLETLPTTMTRYIFAARRFFRSFLGKANADPGTLNVDLQHPGIKISPTF